MIVALYFIGWFAFSIGLSLVVDIPLMIPLWIVLGSVVGIVVFFIGALVFLYLIAPLMKVDSRLKHRIIREAVSFLALFLFNIHIKMEGAENIKSDGPLVLVGNHKSRFDAFILIPAVSRPLALSPKKSLYRVFFLAQMFKVLGYMKVDRDNDRSTAKEMVHVIKRIKNGMAFAIFPEGGTHDKVSEEMLSFRAGAYKIPLKSEADLLMVTIIGANKIAKNLPFKRTEIKIIFHDLLRYDDFKNKSTHQIAEESLQFINNKILEEREKNK